MEFFPRYVQKPMAMYTFLCDQDIPRRAFASHARLHSDVVGQVDYWLEQRCPLAYLGCPFSAIRLRPNCRPDASLAYLPATNTFTVRYDDAAADVTTTATTSSQTAGRNYLDQLSRELVQRIACMLDEVRPLLCFEGTVFHR